MIIYSIYYFATLSIRMKQWGQHFVQKFIHFYYVVPELFNFENKI